MFKEVAEHYAETHSTQLLCCGTRLLLHSYFQRRCWKSQNPRMVWVRRGLKHPLIPVPCCTQGHLPPDQAAQSPIQTGPFQGCCVRKGSVHWQVRKDRWGLFVVASQGQHSPEMCHSAAVVEWGKAEEEALYGWQGATGDRRWNSCSGLLKLKRLFEPPVCRFSLDLGLPGKGSCMQHSHKDLPCS